MVDVSSGSAPNTPVTEVNSGSASNAPVRHIRVSDAINAALIVSSATASNTPVHWTETMRQLLEQVDLEKAATLVNLALALKELSGCDQA